MNDVTIDELAIPERIGGIESVDFERAIEVGNITEAISFGTPDISYGPAEELTTFQNPFTPKRLLVARVDGEIVGIATVEGNAGSTTAYVSAAVHPEFRGRGIGSALTDAIETAARADGRTTAIAFVAVPDPGTADSTGPDRIPSPTGFGSIPRDNRDVRFMQARGYALEQVERVSRLALPVTDLEERLAAAIAASGPEYALHSWAGPTPERFLEDFAVLITRMSTDAPSAGLDEPEDVWTVERLVAEDQRREQTNPRRLATTMAEHLPTGRYVAFTEYSVPSDASRAPGQYATLVLKEHRGHKLGMLVKLANLVHLERISPGHPSVTTFNAEENRPMLDVNEALGFVPIAAEGAWQKVLS